MRNAQQISAQDTHQTRISPNPCGIYVTPIIPVERSTRDTSNDRHTEDANQKQAIDLEQGNITTLYF